ncbi:MAG: DUF4363 family protein [Oscillospiraceae bacterium]|nr:DUF4363 family protein [Oscillospiraceae bacterium]
MKIHRFSLLALALLLALAVFVSLFQQSRSDRWQEMISAADACAVDGDWQGVLSALSKLRESWYGAVPYERLIASHDDLYAFSAALGCAEAAAQEQDRAELRLSLQELSIAAEALKKEARLDWGNIL